MKRSLRSSLTVWYTCLFAVVLCAFQIFLYGRVSRNLYSEMDAFLVLEAGAVSESIFSYWKGESETFFPTPPSASTPFSLQILRGVRAGRFDDFLDRWAVSTHEVMRPMRILGPGGEVLFSSPTFPKPAFKEDASSVQVSGGNSLFRTLKLQDRRVRLATVPVIEDGVHPYSIQVVASLKQADASLMELRYWLLVLTPLTTVVVALLGWRVISSALAPVDRMTKKAASIGLRHLHERIEVPRSGDEIEKLASTFNGMLERLELSVKRLRQFSAAASHELRTPLSIIRGEMEVTLRRTRSEEEYKTAMGSALSAVTELQDIVGQLLSLAYAEEGERGGQWGSLDLADILRKIIESWKPAYEKKRITVDFRQETPGTINGERALLERLFANLLENALKHTPEGGRVEFSLEDAPGGCVCRIADSGPGVPEEDMHRIFDRFFRKDEVQERDPAAGVGLGLGLARWITETHGGNITVSNRPQGGAVFAVFLPS